MKLIVYTCFFSLCISLSVWSAPSQTLGSVAAAKRLSDQAMEDAVRGDYRKAFNRFRRYWPLGKKEIDQAIGRIEEGTQAIHKRFGKPIGFEFIEKTTSKDYLVRFVYAQKFQNALVRWLFTYYKPGKSWHVLSVSFDDDYESLLK